jgi:hypothetical protein
MGRKMMVLQLLEMEIWIKKLKNIADFSTFSNSGEHSHKMEVKIAEGRR